MKPSQLLHYLQTTIQTYICCEHAHAPPVQIPIAQVIFCN